MSLLNEAIINVARANFESARYLEAVPNGHRCRALHGHGFVAQAFASLPLITSRDLGGDVSFLQDHVSSCVRELDYCLLNEVVPQPDDANLAQWILHKLALPTAQRVSVRSTPDQGVIVDSHKRERVWRRYHFHAAHQLPNVPEGHKCGRMHGHGFQVILYADQNVNDSGSKIHYGVLDALWTPLESALNYRCLNEIPGLSNPTSEMIASWIWEQLKPLLPQLTSVAVYETSSCGAAFDGTDYRIWKDFTIDSAIQHQYASPNDQKRRLHGDTFTLRLHLSAPLDQVMGWTVDFGDVKSVFEPIFKDLDHQPLYTRPEFSVGDTASIARWLFQETTEKIEQIVRVDVFGSQGTGSMCGHDLDVCELPA